MIKKEETTSFVIRFTQKVYNDEAGEAQVQWRGNIRHVQGGEEKRFADFNKAMAFMQDKLAELTIQSMEDKPVEEQKGILEKSFGLWKKMALDYPKKVIEGLKDPKGQVEQFQSQVNQIGEALSQNLESEINQWRAASKSDIKQLMEMMTDMAEDIKELKNKVG